MADLFEPGRIGNLEIKNRFVRSATAERLADEDGRFGDEMVELYRALAEGGTGLIVTGHTFVRRDGRASPGMAGIDCDERIADWKKVVDAVHTTDARIAIQINHAGRQTSEGLAGCRPVAPSPVPNAAGMVPRELSSSEIRDLVEAYGEAARRAVEAGFDAVQLHAAHGYLISQFNSPYLNRRTDEWGGTLEKRMKFVLEVYDAARKRVGDQFPIFVKINSEDFVEGGLTVDESSRIAAELCKRGLCAVEISGGIGDVWREIIRPKIKPGEGEAYFKPYVQEFRAAVSVPIILVGGIRSLEVMQKLVSDGGVDFVALCRPLIREPDLPNQFKAGRREPAACLSCNRCMRPSREKGLRCRARR